MSGPMYIGISGKKGTGKSTFAELLVKEIGPSTVIIPLAEAVRDDVDDMLYQFIGFRDHAWLEERKGAVYGPLLQGWGELRRQRDGADYWISALRAKAKGHFTVIVPDVRYPNEAEFIKDQGGLLVSLIGPCRLEADGRDDSHPSEAQVEWIRDLTDMHIYNTRDLDWLAGQATAVAWAMSGPVVA